MADTATAAAITEKQVDFIVRLMVERGMLADQAAADRARTSLAQSYTRRSASAYIEQLLAMPKKASHATPTEPTPEITTDGMYFVDHGDHITVYKVQVAHHGSGKLYAKRLVLGGSQADGPSWEYAGRKPLHDPAMRPMTLDDAKRFGRLYGVCCRCGAILTDETSIAAGIGPVCSGRF